MSGERGKAVVIWGKQKRRRRERKFGEWKMRNVSKVSRRERQKVVDALALATRPEGMCVSCACLVPRCSVGDWG